MQRLTIFYKDRYNMVDPMTGERNSGCKFHCMSAIKLPPGIPNKEGYPYLQVKAPYEQYDSITKLPAKYDCEIVDVPDSKNKITKYLVSAKLVVEDEQESRTQRGSNLKSA